MIEPEGVKIIVKPDVVEEKTEGGIIIPDTSRESEQTRMTVGEVVSIGPDVDSKFVSGDLKIGDRIVYAKYPGVVFRENGCEYRIMNDEDVLGRYEKT